MSEIRRLAGCDLPVGPTDDDVRGHWEPATCAEYSAAIEAVGGLDGLHVWSSLTDMAGVYGSPRIFTCWGTDDDPVAAAGGDPGRRFGDHHPCGLDHAVFVADGCPAGGEHKWVWQPPEIDVARVGFWSCDERGEQPSPEEIKRWADV